MLILNEQTPVAEDSNNSFCEFLRKKETGPTPPISTATVDNPVGLCRGFRPNAASMRLALACPPNGHLSLSVTK